MYRREKKSSTEIRMMTTVEGATYTGRGQSSFRAWANEIGATRHYGRSVRYDKKVIDAALDAMGTATQEGDI